MLSGSAGRGTGKREKALDKTGHVNFGNGATACEMGVLQCGAPAYILPGGGFSARLWRVVMGTVSVVMLCLGLSAAPPAARLQMVLVQPAPAWQAGIDSLRAALQHRARLRPLPNVLRVSGVAAAVDLTKLQAAVDAAQQHYINLDSQAALDSAHRVETDLAQHLDVPAARSLLARALRIEGLTELYLRQKDAAAMQFAAAARLDDSFSPAADQWPPAARLAYADALATAHRAAPGSLSLRVTPAFAAVWVDGRRVGLGSTTVGSLAPGTHFVLARAPGFRSVAATVSVSGDGQLDDHAVFLEAVPRAKRPGAVAAYVAATLGSSEQAAALHQLAAAESADAVLVVRADSLTPNQAAVWLYDAHGERLGAPMGLQDPWHTAADIQTRLAGGTGAAVPAAPTPWYRSWVAWSVAGSVVVAGVVTAAAVLASQHRSNHITLLVGGPQ